MANNNCDENGPSDKDPVEMDVEAGKSGEKTEPAGSTRVHGKSSAPSSSSPIHKDSKKIKLDGEEEGNDLPIENLQTIDNSNTADDQSSDEDEEEQNDAAADGPSNVAFSDEEDEVEEKPYEVLSPQDIAEHMNDCIQNANEVLQLPSTTMRVLMNHCGWDKEKLHDAYFGSGDSEKLFKDAGVVSPTSEAQSESSVPSSGNGANAEEECPVCFSMKKPADIHELKCGHRFCADCWTEYLTTKIMGEGVGPADITCLEHNCPIVVDYDTIKKFTNDADMKAKYENLMNNSFVQSNRLLKWCPSPDCTKAIKVKMVSKRGGYPVKCTCGHIFCFHCGRNSHDTVTCALVEKWIRKLEDESETSNWISANTKNCPKCEAKIQKDGGCNTMRCASCGYRFCWICLESVYSHNAYTCNQYNEKAAKAQDESRQALDRYLFYYDRFANHQMSLKLEHKLYAKVEKKVAKLQDQDHNVNYVDVQFLKEAVDVLCKCRQTLMNTYILAYNLVKTNETEVFADNQNDLQAAVEKLSYSLEWDINSDNMMDMKSQVMHLCKYCKDRSQVLIDHVTEGYDKDTWTFIE